MNKVEEYIEKHWDECIKENRNDEGNLIGLPYPYIVPAVGHFDEMYYWDTYFTNKGLIISGLTMQAKHNVDNMLYMVDKYGFMPNGNRTFYLNRSQPPFLSQMVRDVYDVYGDTCWLKLAYHILEKEYDFWMSKRRHENGLNVYGGEVAEDEIDEVVDSFARRIKSTPEGKKADVVKHVILSCESGWDMNPRWGITGYDYAMVDLNSLMYMHENNMEYFAKELGLKEAEIWGKRKRDRQSLMTELMQEENGVLLDYNVKEDKFSPVFSAASYYPLFVGMANKEQARAAVDNLDRIEEEYGIVACEKNNDKGVYQWDYPNGWACLQYIVMAGLDNYGYKDDAKRIAEKYVNLVDKVFEQTGNLWEKYNVIKGNIEVQDEYKMPAMMGWSAGIYLAAKKYLEEVNRTSNLNH